MTPLTPYNPASSFSVIQSGSLLEDARESCFCFSQLASHWLDCNSVGLEEVRRDLSSHLEYEQTAIRELISALENGEEPRVIEELREQRRERLNRLSSEAQVLLRTDEELQILLEEVDTIFERCLPQHSVEQDLSSSPLESLQAPGEGRELAATELAAPLDSGQGGLESAQTILGSEYNRYSTISVPGDHERTEWIRLHTKVRKLDSGAGELISANS